MMISITLKYIWKSVNIEQKNIEKKRWLNKTFDSDPSDNEPDSGTDSESDSDADDNNESEKSSKKSEKSSKKSENPSKKWY